MPVRSRGPLLAGLTTLLGLCTAGAGCQSSAGLFGPNHPTDAFAIRPAAVAAHRSFFPWRRPQPEDTTPQTAVAEVPMPSGYFNRPVAQAATPQGVVIASTMQPVQRVSAEQFQPGPDVSPVPLGDPVPRPGPLEVINPGNGISLRSTTEPQQPERVTIAVSDPGQGSAGDATNTLPPPTPEGGPLQAVPEGPYPPPGIHIPVGPHGPDHGLDVPKELRKRALSTYIIEPPDILLIQATGAVTDPKVQPLEGQHLVRLDGSISLGVYGQVFVAGKTLDQAADAIALALQAYLGKKDLTVDKIKRELSVDVLAYNSKYYYVITDGGGYGEQVYRLSVTGNETVLDAISQINGLPPVASKKKIWVARATPYSHNPAKLPVDWCAITQQGEAATNYQLFPGDRIYVQSNSLIRADSFLAKLYAPIERTFGVILLGSTTVNSLKSGGSGGGTGAGAGAGAVR